MKCFISQNYLKWKKTKKQRENTETNKKRICRYGLEMKARECLFDVYVIKIIMLGYSRSKSDFRELLYAKYKPMEETKWMLMIMSREYRFLTYLDER